MENKEKERDRSNECLTCSNPKLPTGDYCEWCQHKIDTYEPDEKEEGE